MPAAETTRNKPAPRLLTIAFWAGVGLAPLALLIMVVGASAGAIEVALALGLIAIVLIGVSMALRNDSVPVKNEVEQLVYDEIDTLRDDIREDITHAARSTHKALADRIVQLSETVDVLRGRVDTMSDQVGRVAAPPVAPHTTGVGHVPGGVVRHTETVQVTTRQTMLVDPHDTHRDGTVYGNRLPEYGTRQPGFGPAADQGFRDPQPSQGFRGPERDQGFRGPEPDRRRDAQPPPDDRVRASARPPQARGPEESRSGRARVGAGRPEQVPPGRARVEPEGFDQGAVGRGTPGDRPGRARVGVGRAEAPGGVDQSRSGRARVGVGRPEQERFDGPGPVDADGRQGGTNGLAARADAPSGARRGDGGDTRRRPGPGDGPPPRSGLAEVFQRRAESAAQGRDATGWQGDPGSPDRSGAVPFIPQQRRAPALESSAPPEPWSDQLLRERLNRPEPDDRDRVGRRRTDPEPEERTGRRRADPEPEERTGRRRREEPSSGDAWSSRRGDEPSSGDAWSTRRPADDHDGSGEWTTTGTAGRRRAPDDGHERVQSGRVDFESDSGRVRAGDGRRGYDDRIDFESDSGRGGEDRGYGGPAPGRRRAPEERYDSDVPDGGGGRRRAEEDTTGRRRAYDPEDDGSRVTGVRTADRWASVRSDDRGARELRMGERRSAVHEDATGTELHIEDRWARVREEPGPRRSQARLERDRDAWGAGEPSEAWGPADRTESTWSETRWDDGGRRLGQAPALPAAPQADDDSYAWNRAAGGDRGASSHRLVDFEDDDDRWR
jgi:hypothetical protein